MKDKIKIVLIPIIGGLIQPVLLKLLEKPFDPGMTAAWIVLVIAVTLVAALVLWPASGRKRKPAPRRPGEMQPTQSQIRATKPADASDTVDVSPLAVMRGFWFALGAGLCWSISNVLLRLTADKVPAASFDIAMLNYLVASAALVLGGFLGCRKKNQKFCFPRAKSGATFWLGAAAKGVNTYSWILSVTLISAASAATLEGLHVAFTVAILFFILKVKAPVGSWATLAMGSVLLVVGALLILDVTASAPDRAAVGGISLGLLSGLSFSVFYVAWERSSHRPAERWQRATEMGGLLLASLLCQFPVHIVVNAVWLKGSLVPLAGMSLADVGIQTLCGLVGIGATYFLINESLHLMRPHRFCSLLLGIGLSYSVPFTMILESLLLQQPVVFNQWMGTLVFASAFAAIYKNVHESRALKQLKTVLAA